MFRHYLIAALRNLAANKLQSAIAILGLSIGITVAILAAAVVRNQTTFDHFISGYDRTYVHVDTSGYANAPIGLAASLSLESPEIEAIARLCTDQKEFRHGNTASDEHFYE